MLIFLLFLATAPEVQQLIVNKQELITVCQYIPYEEEIVTYKQIHCNWFGINDKEPCYGKVIKDYIYFKGYDGSEGTEYYTCEGHYDCIENGSYVPIEESINGK